MSPNPIDPLKVRSWAMRGRVVCMDSTSRAFDDAAVYIEKEPSRGLYLRRRGA